MEKYDVRTRRFPEFDRELRCYDFEIGSNPVAARIIAQRFYPFIVRHVRRPIFHCRCLISYNHAS
jgi:hypothetical protein